MLVLTLCIVSAFIFEVNTCETSSFKNIRVVVSDKQKQNSNDVILNDCLERNNDTRNYFTVEVTSQNIEKLNRGAFADLPVVTLILSNNRITQIEKGAFQNLRSVQTVNLSKNKLSALFKDVLNDFVSMKFLDLSENRLEQIEDQAFAHLVSLQELILSGNKLKVWNANWFANNVALNKFEIQGNLLEDLPENSFPDMEKLSSLILKNNNLKEIHWNAFKGLTSLKVLDMSFNKLVKLHQDTFAPFNGVIDTANQDRFSIIRPYNVFAGLWNLYIHSNNLTYFSDKMMQDLSNTGSLNFFTFHTNPWQCGCYRKIVKWADNRRIRLNSQGKGCYRRDNPVCVVPKENPNECVEDVQEDIRSLYFSKYKIPVENFFDRSVVCNMF